MEPLHGSDSVLLLWVMAGIHSSWAANSASFLMLSCEGRPSLKDRQTDTVPHRPPEITKV